MTRDIERGRFGPHLREACLIGGAWRAAESGRTISIHDPATGETAYLYTRDLGRTFRVMEQLEHGLQGVNTGMASAEVAPFGGFKDSGVGREGSKYGVD